MAESQTQTKQVTQRGLKTVVLLLIVAALIIAIILLLLLRVNRTSGIPEFEIIDNGGQWEAQGTIAVFDDTIKPGSSGEYDFIISNTADVKLKYTFVMDENFDEMYAGSISFMQYRLRMNGKNMESEEWRSIDELLYDGIVILAKTKQLMTFEWRWPFESGNDENDTNIGDFGGWFSVTFHLEAEVVE